MLEKGRAGARAPRRVLAIFRHVFAAERDPRIDAARARTLLARAVASCWVAFAIIPFTIVGYDAVFFPAQLGKGALAAVAANALILLLLFAVRRRAFDRCTWLPFALLAGVICNATEAANLMLTGGPLASNFVFPYHLVAFGIAILFPAPFFAVVGTAALLPLGYLALALAVHAPLGSERLVSNLMVLVDSAGIASIGNVVVTRSFLREVLLRMDLETANDQLRKLDRVKSEFFANVSHELRTPLTLILAPATSLAREQLLPAHQGLVDTIQRNATRLLQLINDLLLLARLEAGAPDLQRQPVDVAAQARHIVGEAQAYAQSLGLRLVVQAPAEPLIWMGEPRHFERILLNLVSNACKFSFPGGEVRAVVERKGDGIDISVEDHGIGIAAKDVDKIFERFVQLEASAKRRFEGTGIGLSIVKQLVTLHGGTISLQSEVGKGSTFRIHFPPGAPASEPVVAPPESAAVKLQPALPEPAPALAAAGARLLVVEDNTELLRYLTRELGRWYRITPFPDSTKALESAKAEPPDLVVSDIMMPGLDGIELARELRQEPATAEVPVLLLSAREEVEAKLAGFEAGADDYVQKPFELRELRARIELHLRLRAQARDLRRALLQLKQAESSLVQSEKMVALGRMVAGVAHELNNPLHFLRGNLTLLRRRVAGDEKLGPLFADVDESVERMTSLTRQLLLFGRKHGDGGMQVKVSEVVPLVVKMVSPHVPSGVRIVQQVDGQMVRANPQDLFQILLNVVHNAVQAVDPNAGEVRIASARRGDQVELQVSDNGCGIAPDHLSRVFDPFFTTKPPGSGTGLGLSIVQQLVTAQEGWVRLESAPGKGTVVTVSLQAVAG